MAEIETREQCTVPVERLPTRVMLCMHPSHFGEFYLPLGMERALCPYDRTHRVVTYSKPFLQLGEEDPMDRLDRLNQETR